MKKLLLLCICLTSFHLFAQSTSYAGTYVYEVDPINAGVRKYTLNLNADGSFFFHYFKASEGDCCPEKNSYGKGTWKSKKKAIFFYADPATDLDEKHTMDFNNTKAISNRKSPRNKSKEIVKEEIRFYESDIFWLKGNRLFLVSS